MKLVKQSDDLLIVHGYGWLRFAAALACMLATPLWVWIAYHVPLIETIFNKSQSEEMRRFGLMVIAAIAPTGLFFLVRGKYKNWQLILDASYNEGALHIGTWGARQTTQSFPLQTLAGAKRKTRTRQVQTKSGKKTQEEHSLMLSFSDARHPIHVCDASAGEIDRIGWIITDWAKSATPAAALDSAPVQS